MTTKFQLLNYLFIFIGLIDVVIFAKIFPTILCRINIVNSIYFRDYYECYAK